jgi:hypothetical protein
MRWQALTGDDSGVSGQGGVPLGKCCRGRRIPQIGKKYREGKCVFYISINKQVM